MAAIRREELERLSGSASYADSIAHARQRLVQGRTATAAEVRRVYRRAAESVRRDIEGLTAVGLRRGHLQALAKALEGRARELNQGILEAACRGVRLGAAAGVAGPAGVAEDLLASTFARADVRRLFAGINERAVLALLARTRADGLALSDRVWRISQRARTAVTRLVEDGVARGLDSRRLARDVQHYLRPNVWTAHKMETRLRLGVPADVSYEAMRLARTEVTNAYHEGMVAANQGTPGYRGVYWRLSGSHPLADVCDRMASTTEHGEPGFYPKGKEPARPHPQCMCNVVPAFESPKAMAERLRDWTRDPESQPELEAWYNGDAGSFLARPGGAFGGPAGGGAGAGGFGGGPGGGPPGGARSPADALISRAVAEQAQLTPDEVNLVVSHVVQAPFDSRPIKAGNKLAGLTFEGRVLERNSRLPSDVQHWLSHTIGDQQWPVGTTKDQYIAAVRAAATHPGAEVATYRYRAEDCAGFLAPNEMLQPAPGSKEYIWVTYSATWGGIRTGFQTNGAFPVPGGTGRYVFENLLPELFLRQR